MKLYSVAASVRYNTEVMVIANCALANSAEEALDWFSGHIETKYHPRDGYFGHTYDCCQVPEEIR